MNRIYKALSDPTRRKILKMLRDKDMSAGEIAEHFEITKPSLSKHFNILKDADLIQSEREGTTIIYHLNVSVLEEALLALMDMFNLKEKL
ncbi:MAG: winged helix-turn-helix transcriptional regulator [Candidatus Marinimicrobia bacterium]|nr:winged helix-turn-helix transcriptional regulator [Candidatus Neomarinimicrobiota bacterium]RKY56566.1 MAG: transcriptional regulator [Candidatus Neomarinimicrobiota bacterium]